MATNLRSLLSYPGEAVTQLPPGCAWIWQGTCHQCNMQSYHEYCCTNWVVPPYGLTCCTATIEMWGGGGAGGGSCCCAYGPPGSSGAYTKKTLTVIPCTCFVAQLGAATNCTCANTGDRGCTTFITGPVLQVCGTTCATANADNRQYMFGTCFCTLGQQGATICGTGIPATTTVTAVCQFFTACATITGSGTAGTCCITMGPTFSGTAAVGMCIWPNATNIGSCSWNQCFPTNVYITEKVSGTGANSTWNINSNFAYCGPVCGYGLVMSNAATATNSNGTVYTVCYGAPYCVNNFCAEGGYGGCAYCAGAFACCFSACTCAPGCTASNVTATAGVISNTTFTAGGTISGGPGAFGLNFVLSGTGVTAGTTIIGCTSPTSWTVDRCSAGGVAASTITGTAPLTACAYGGDINIQGVKGCAWFICCDNPCYNKQFIAYPAGLVNQCGGTTLAGTWSTGYNDTFTCTALSYVGYAYQAMQYTPGFGGATFHTTNGCCSQGFPGRPGLIKITYR